jgi:type VI secretion system protein ImpL
VSAWRDGALAGRWTVGALAWATLSAAAWFAGDALVIAGERPLDGPLARLAFVVALAALWLGWELWRVRRSLLENQRLLDGLVSGVADADSAERAAHELALLKKRFEDALQVLRKSRFRGPHGERRTVAELPWYMFIGAPGSGKTTALLNAGLRFPLGDPRGETLQGVGGTRNCDWWFTEEAVLLDTAGRYTTQESDREADAAAWLGFLDLLKRFRPRQPLNGALVTLSVSDLVHWNEDELARYAAHVRDRLDELYEKLGVRPPVYVLVTKADLLGGFNEFFSEFDAEHRAQVWGTTFDASERAAEGHVIVARFAEELGTLERRLYALLPGRLLEERDLQRRAAIYRFPQQLRATGPLLGNFLAAVFASGQARYTPYLRGVYFTSGTQEGSPIDRVLGTLARTFDLERKVQPPAPGTGKSFFLKRLLREVIFAEAGLGGLDATCDRRRRLALAAGLAGVFATTATLAGVWTLSYFRNRELVAAAERATAAVMRELELQPAVLRATDETRLLAVLDRLRELRSEVAPGGTLVHVGLGQGDKLRAQAARAYRTALRESLLPHAVSSLEHALRKAPSRVALEAYVSLYDAGRPDVAAMQAALARIWNLPVELRGRLAVHLADALEERPFSPGHVRNDLLVEAARLRLGRGVRL